MPIPPTRTVASLVTLSLPCLASAQAPGVLDAARARWITQEVSGDAAFEHIRFMTQYHRPRGGSDGLWSVAEYYAREAQELGLETRLIRQADDTRPWNARFADLWLVGERPERLASTLQTAVHLADFSRPTDTTGELVDVDDGADDEAGWDALDVRGKIVLTHGAMGTAMREAVQERGALGVIWFPSPFASGNGIDGGGATRFDQVRWTSISPQDPPAGASEGAPTFAFSLSLRQGLLLRDRLRGAGKPLVAHAIVDSAFDSTQGKEPWQVMVEAVLPGSDPGAHQDVVLTGHMQEEATSANDDASGCASTLEVARALQALITSGRIPRPRRSLRFWWTTEISSERQLFADHPELVRELWVNVNQDMVGADQSQDILRKQCITRLPATRFHFLNDVMEAVVESMVAANNFELSQLQNGILLYPEPHVAHRGTWQRWNAESIFFHENTDHMTFTEAPIGIPGITFTNMPDRYIHSSDDDLWNIDPTQLGRSAASVALIAYTMASAGPENAARLEAEVVGRGEERFSRNLRLALTAVAEAHGDGNAFHEGLDQIRYAAERERLALRSLRDSGATSVRLDELLGALALRESQAVAELEAAQRQASGASSAPAREVSEAEKELAALRPAPSAGPREFLEGRQKLHGAPGLHALMATEVLAAVDGQRSGLDIARFVAGEAREAGAHYYGTVAPAAVLTHLKNAAEAGLIRLQ